MKFPAEIPFIAKLAKKLGHLGLQKDNTYLFAQGHTIQDNVVLMFMKPVCLMLIKQKEQQIRGLSTAIGDDMNKYLKHKKQFSIENVLLAHTAFKNSELYQKIHTDLEQYIKNFPKK